MFLNMCNLPLSIVSLIGSVQNIIAGSSKVHVDPSRAVAGCRMVMDPKGKQPVVAQCFKDKELLSAAQAQGLQCRMEPKLTLEPGKATVEFLVFCGPKTLAQREVRRAKVYFGEQLHKRTFKQLKMHGGKIKDLSRHFQMRHLEEWQKLPRANPNRFKD